MHLYFAQAQLRTRRARAARIADVNAAFAGGKDGKALYQAMVSED